MLHTRILTPGAGTGLFGPKTPPHLAERRRARLLRLTAPFAREDIEATIDALIARLDEADGDPDLEAFTLPLGCQYVPAADLALLADDEEPAAEAGGDPSWTEWSGRGGRTLRSPYEEIGSGEEDEEAAGDEADGNGSEEDFMAHVMDGPGCPVADGTDAAWPERDKQPNYMGGGLSGEMDEDAEPWFVAAVTSSQPINDNDRRAA